MEDARSVAAPSRRERLLERTRRAVAAGNPAVTSGDLGALREVLAAAESNVLVIRAGAWLPKMGELPQLGGGAWLAVGVPDAPGSLETELWRKVLERTGGDLSRMPRWWPFPPVPPVLLISRAAAGKFATLLRDGGTLDTAWHAWLSGEAARKVAAASRRGESPSIHKPPWRTLPARLVFAATVLCRTILSRAWPRKGGRTVHLPHLDAVEGEEIRVLQVVTSIQIGGAERVTLDLAAELPRVGVAAAVVALGRATRTAFPPPPGFIDLSHIPANGAARAAAILEVAQQTGADLVHAHLLRARELAEIAATGLPLIVTAHNLPPGWPPDYSPAETPPDLPFPNPAVCAAPAAHGAPALGETGAALILGCAQVVTEALLTRFPAIPARTLWNGILPRPAPRDRRALGWPEDAWIVLVLANPRAQKRLERLPAIARALAIRLAPRPVRLVLAGASEPGSADAAEALAALDAEVERHAVHDLLLRPGLIADPAPLLAAADVLLSVSAWEGFSLAHLEALAAGLPVVATDAGGTREIAAQSPALTLLPLAATDDEIAAALAAVATVTSGLGVPPMLPRHSIVSPTLQRDSNVPPISSRDMGRIPMPLTSPALPPSFTRAAMARRAAWLYPRAIQRALGKKSPAGLWLIANNFSTGGAQASARRLLNALHAQGVRVRAAVIQEQPDFPTPGRAALEAVGIPVLAVPPAGDGPIEPALDPLLEALEADPAPVVFFWNLIASWKVLLADALLDARIFDISPGEMFFPALTRFFERPFAGLPYRTPRDYGARLAGAVVKYAAEAPRAAEVLGCPVHVIRNGILCSAVYETVGLSSDPGLPQGDGQPGATPPPIVFGTAARLSPDKKLDDLLAAVRLAAPRLPPFVLRIAGGPERDFPAHAAELRALAAGLPVEWLGEIQAMPDFLRDLDIFLMISEPAGCPNASLEALAAGLPIVATDFGGASEQVLDRVTGRLTPRSEPAAFADAMVDLARDAPLRTRLGAAAREHARTEFSLERMVAEYRRLAGL